MIRRTSKGRREDETKLGPLLFFLALLKAEIREQKVKCNQKNQTKEIKTF